MTISGDTTGAIQAIADGVDPDLLVAPYADAVGGIINQHGWNLLWFGVITIVGAGYIWREHATAIFITAVVGGWRISAIFSFWISPGT